MFGQAIHRFLVVAYEAVMCVLFSLPRFSVLNRLKALFLRAVGARIGRNVTFYTGTSTAPGAISSLAIRSISPFRC